MHVEHLFVEGEKMSKSLGNTYTLADVVARGHRPSALRYLLLSSHYRKQLNFTWTGMDQAEEAIRRIVDFLARLEAVDGDGGPSKVAEVVENARKAFRSALEHDLNTAAALAAVYDLVRDVNAAIDARDIAGRRESRATGDRGVRSRARRGEPPAGRGCESSGAGGGDRAPDRGAPGRPPAPRLRGCRRHPATTGRSGRAARRQPGARAGKNEHDDIADDRPIRQNGPAGPRAKAIIERDGRVVSPSTHAITRS